MKKFTISFCLLFSLIVLPVIIPNLQSAYAANITLNKTKKTIYEGDKYTLKVKGTKKKVTWSSSNKSIAKVNSNGKVTAKRNGTTTITAKVGKTELKCKIKVRLIQYKDDIFYTLKEVSKLYNVKEIENKKTFTIDLDGDGEIENITIEPYKYQNEYGAEYIDYIYKLNDKEFLKTDTCLAYFVDLDKNDKTVEFIIPSPLPYDCDRENRYAIYVKDGDTMKFIDHIDISRDMRINQKGTILVDTYLQKGLYISPRIYTYYYKFKNNKITKKKLSINKIKNQTFTLNSSKYYPWYIAGSKKNYKKGQNFLYYEVSYSKMLKYNIKRLRKGAKFKILDFLDDEGEMYVKLSNGRKGYVLNPYKYEHE